MTQKIILVLIGFALVVAIPAQAAKPGSTSKSELQLSAVQKAWISAEDNRDAAKLRRILDPRFIFVYGASAPHSRDDFIRGVISSKSRKVRQSLRDTTIIVDRDTAIVAGLDSVTGSLKGQPYANVYRYTATYVHRHGRWVALAEHLVHQ